MRYACFVVMCFACVALVRAEVPPAPPVGLEHPLPPLPPLYAYQDAHVTVDGLAMAAEHTTGMRIWGRMKPKGFVPRNTESIPIFRYWEHTYKDAAVSTVVWTWFPHTKCYKVTNPSGVVNWFAAADMLRESNLTFPAGGSWYLSTNRQYFYEERTVGEEGPWYDITLCRPGKAWAGVPGCAIEEFDLEPFALPPDEEDYG